MRRYVKPALRYSANTTSKIVSQVFIAVIAALLVTFITNSAMLDRGRDAAAAPQGMAAFGDLSGSRPAPSLPPLEVVVIEDLAEPLSQPSTPEIAAPAGLYYAEGEQLPDALQLLSQSGG